jgi:hypothetical protein
VERLDVHEQDTPLADVELRHERATSGCDGHDRGSLVVSQGQFSGFCHHAQRFSSGAG